MNYRYDPYKSAITLKRLLVEKFKNDQSMAVDIKHAFTSDLSDSEMISTEEAIKRVNEIINPIEVTGTVADSIAAYLGVKVEEIFIPIKEE